MKDKLGEIIFELKLMQLNVVNYFILVFFLIFEIERSIFFYEMGYPILGILVI